MQTQLCRLSLMPAELQLLILGMLPDSRDLSAFSRTNKSFHSIGNAALYGKEISLDDWRVVFWAAERGVVGTLRQWASIRNPDGNIRAPWDVYTTKRARADGGTNDEATPRYITGPSMGRGSYILGPLGPEARERYLRRHSPLHVAAKKGHADVVEFLLAHGADINAQSLGLVPGGLTVFRDARDRHNFFEPSCITLNALHVAILFGQSEVAKLLLRAGIELRIAPLREQWDSHISALHLVAAYPHPIGNMTLLRIIGERPDVDVNAPDEDGQTPLMYAAESQPESFKAAKVLVELGADVNSVIRTRDGREASLLVTLIRRIRWKAALGLIDLGASLEMGEGERSLLDECERARMSVIHPEVVDEEAYAQLVSRLGGVEVLDRAIQHARPLGFLGKVVMRLRR